MKRYLLLLCFIQTFIFLTSDGALAQPPEEENIDELMSLDIESLMNVNVSVASKKSESISEAPSIVSVITAEDIRRFGATNLRDVLNRQTSIQAYGSTFLPENVVSIRGGAIQHENNHILILINGRPYRDGLSGGDVASLLSSFPLDIIEAIEIIRGPGSVLYGSSAFNGVINIKTKPASDVGMANFSTTYGSFNTRSVDASGAYSGEDWSIIGAMKSMKSEGWTYDVIDGAGTPGSFDLGETDGSLTLNANYQNFDFNFFKGRTKQNALGPAATYPVGTNKQSTVFADLGYTLKISEDWKAKFNATYNTLHFSFSNGIPPSPLKSEDILLEASVRGEVTDKISILFGGTYENHDSVISMNVNPSVQWYSGYFQAEYTPFYWLKLVAGTQMNKPKDLKKDFSPRYAAIVNFDKNWGTKLLYGEAFRSPYFTETSLVSPGIIFGNPDLTPEKIETSEAQLFYNTENYAAAVTVYHSQMSDLIARVGFPINFTNSREIEFNGVEIEGRANITDRLGLIGNASYQTSEDNLGLEETTYTPNLMIKTGISYDSPAGYSLGLFNSYFGDPSQVRDFQPVVERNPEPEDHNLVTFNASLDVDRLLQNENMPNMTAEFFIDNLLNEEIRFPDINNGSINSIPIHSGRAVYGRVTVKF